MTDGRTDGWMIRRSMSVCSETCSASVQRPRGRHCGNVHGAAMPGERGLPGPAVPLVPQRRGAPPGLQNQPQVCQLLLQHQPRHWRPGETDGGRMTRAHWSPRVVRTEKNRCKKTRNDVFDKCVGCLHNSTGAALLV